MIFHRARLKSIDGMNAPPPPEIFRFFLKSEGKEIERKRKNKGCWGGGLPLNIFLELIFFRVRLRYFQGGWEIFGRGWEFFGGGGGGVEKFIFGWVENFSGGWEIFEGGLRNFFWGGRVENFFGEGGWEISGGVNLLLFRGGGNFFR